MSLLHAALTIVFTSSIMHATLQCSLHNSQNVAFLPNFTGRRSLLRDIRMATMKSAKHSCITQIPVSCMCRCQPWYCFHQYCKPFVGRMCCCKTVSSHASDCVATHSFHFCIECKARMIDMCCILYADISSQSSAPQTAIIPCLRMCRPVHVHMLIHFRTVLKT